MSGKTQGMLIAFLKSDHDSTMIPFATVKRMRAMIDSLNFLVVGGKLVVTPIAQVDKGRSLRYGSRRSLWLKVEKVD